MAAPAYAGRGIGETDAASPVTTISGRVATVGNVVILQILQDGPTAGLTLDFVDDVEDLAGTANTMTSIGAFPVGSPTAALQHLWIGRATAAAIAGADVSGYASEDIYVLFWEFSDVNTGTTLADVIENGTAGNATNGAGTSDTILDTAVTTLGADRLALNFVAVNDDNALDAFTGMTGGTWGEPGVEYADAAGTDGAIGLQTAAMASAGTIDGGTLTMAASDAWGVVGFALIPEPSTVPALLLEQPNFIYLRHNR